MTTPPYGSQPPVQPTQPLPATPAGPSFAPGQPTATQQAPYGQQPYGQQAPYGQQPYAQAPYGAPGQFPGKPVEDPGKTLGIVGIVLAFMCSIAGIVVSAISRKKSKEAGFKPTLGTVGLVLSIVTTVFGLVWATIVIIATVSATTVTAHAINDAVEQTQQTTAADDSADDATDDTLADDTTGDDTLADDSTDDTTDTSASGTATAFCTDFNAANQKMLDIGMPDTSDKEALKKYGESLQEVDDDLHAINAPSEIASDWKIVTGYYDLLAEVYSSPDLSGASKLSGKTTEFSDAVANVQSYMIDSCY